MSCRKCAEALKEYGEEPICIDGECLVGIDRLPEEALRILEIRGLLVSLEGLGLAGVIDREFGIDREDLELLAFVEDTVRILRPKKDGEANGSGQP